VILEGQPVAPLHDEEIEAMARAMLRETIQRSGWYPTLREKERQMLIERDVEHHWYLMTADARRALERSTKTGNLI
jgi:hypothetical protein